MRILGILAVGLLCAGSGAIALLYFKQSALLYPAPTQSFPPAALLGDAEKISLSESYGLLLEPTESPDSPYPLVIFAHGNGEAAFMWVPAFDELRDRGIGVFLLEYPGYAGAGGSPNLQAIEGAIVEAYDRLVARPEVDGTRIVAYGRSIGSGAASLLAAKRPVAALALESGFSSLPLLLREKGLPAFLLRDRYDNAAIVKTLRVPIFLYHGTEDATIPISHSQTLAAAGREVTFASANCGHNNCPRPWPTLLSFLEEKLVLGAID